MTVRSEDEIKACIATIEEIYPPGKMVYGDAIGNYMLGTLAGLKVALGEYPTYAEMDMEDFFQYFNELTQDIARKIRMKARIKRMKLAKENVIIDIHANQGTQGTLD
ncbi:hypothetical protein ES703_69662 [subsurface metagenome]